MYRGNVIALGFVIVNKLAPSVVAPKAVRAVAAVVAPVPPLAKGSVPVTPVVKGKPVALVKTTELGVPKAGVTNVGLVENTKFVLVVPVAPAAVYPVMLLNEAIPAVLALVPPLATGSTPET